MTEEDTKPIGDMVDLRVCCKGVDGKPIDLVNFEFASNNKGTNFVKIAGVEGKVIVVKQVYNGLYTATKDCFLRLLVDGLDIKKTHAFPVYLF
ncbi:unnamed protein product [Rhizopus stolonifer]